MGAMESLDITAVHLHCKELQMVLLSFAGDGRYRKWYVWVLQDPNVTRLLRIKKTHGQNIASCRDNADRLGKFQFLYRGFEAQKYVWGVEFEPCAVYRIGDKEFYSSGNALYLVCIHNISRDFLHVA